MHRIDAIGLEERSMPIALWCVLLAGIMPVVTTGIAKWGAPLDNNHPRDWANNLAGYRRRAYAAHQNSYEAFPFFGVAVLAAGATGASQGLVNLLAMLFIAARIGYTGAYLANLATLRSVLWAVGWFATIAIFTSAVWG
jgi:uncharacterized MAPEG superfamily protein